MCLINGQIYFQNFHHIYIPTHRLLFVTDDLWIILWVSTTAWSRLAECLPVKDKRLVYVKSFFQMQYSVSFSLAKTILLLEWSEKLYVELQGLQD